MEKVGRPRTYETVEKYSNAIDDYFNSISRTETLNDMNGNTIINDTGEPIKKRVFYEPPSVTGLCSHIGITRDTFSEYGKRDNCFSDTNTRAKEIILRYNESELLRREKSVEGIKFNLMYNFGWSERKDVNINANIKQNELLSLDDKIKYIDDIKNGII